MLLPVLSGQKSCEEIITHGADWYATHGVTFRFGEKVMAIDRARKVVIGSGLLGLEAAAGMQLRGMDVTVIHLMGHLMERQLDAAAGYLLQKALEKRGIRIHCKGATKAILGVPSWTQWRPLRPCRLRARFVAVTACPRARS